ncbi:MAG TPA: YgjV family protein [Stellaceae bacterium]|nr:YgjV family protein [Stellaceae bacterium]
MTLLATSAHSIFCFFSLANCAGLFGIFLGASWALLSRRSAILLCQAAGALAFALHFLLLGSLDGALMCLAGAMQSGVARAPLRRNALLACYGLSLALAGAVTFATTTGLPPYFAALGLVSATIGRMQNDTQRMRLFFLAGTAAWAVHNFLVGSVVGNASDVLTAAGILAGLWAHRWRAPVALLAPPRPVRA